MDKKPQPKYQIYDTVYRTSAYKILKGTILSIHVPAYPAGTKDPRYEYKVTYSDISLYPKESDIITDPAGLAKQIIAEHEKVIMSYQDKIYALTKAYLNN